MSDIEIEPAMDETSRCSSKQINQFIGSLLSMIVSVMTKSVTDATVVKAEREVKFFLSYLNILDCRIENNNDSNRRKRFGYQNITIYHC